MKKLFILLIGGILLVACQSSSALNPIGSPTQLGCDTPGTIERMSLEETSRGYPYRYGLYLPPCYDSQPDRLYPLLIHLPGRGGSASDFINAGGFALADEMILNGEVPPFIIVTTETTDSESEKNGESILNDLLPYIESHYRIKPEREFHVVAGVSLGGIATYRIVFSHPEQFASGAMFGSGAIAGEEDQIRTWMAAMKPEDTLRFFFDSAEGDPYMLERARVMAELLDEVGIPYVLNVGGGGHNYDYWMQNMPLYFRWIAQTW